MFVYFETLLKQIKMLRLDSSYITSWPRAGNNLRRFHLAYKL